MCTWKEILSGLMKLRYTLGNIYEVHWFQKPPGSLQMPQNEFLVWFLMDDSRKKKIAMFDMRLGNEPNFLRVECDFLQTSKIPDAPWSLSKISRPHEMEIRGEKHTDVQLSRAHFGVSANQSFSQGPDHILRETRRLTPFPWSPEPQRKCPVEQLDECQTLVDETLWAFCKLRWPTCLFYTISLHPWVLCTSSLHLWM